MDHPSVIVLGANGRFGRAATEAFAAAGWRVLAQLRRAPSSPLPPGAEALLLPLADTAGLAAAVAGACAVVHAVNPPYTRWQQDLLPMARLGMALAQRLGARFLLPGNVYGYGEGMPATLTEATPERPTTDKGRLRQTLEAEMAQRSQDAAAPLHATVIRAGDFYGSGTGSWLDLIIAKDLARGRLRYPGPMDLPHAWAYLPDLACAFVDAAAQPLSLPGVQRLHFEGHTLTGTQLLGAVEAAAGDLGLTPKRGWQRRRMSWWPLKLAALVWPMGREIVDMAYLWRVPHALDGRALRAALGPLPDTPVRQAMRSALVALGHASPAGIPAGQST